MKDDGRDDQGQAATELALVVPLVVLLLLAAIQVTLVARDQILVVHAARVAAREAAINDGGAGDDGGNVRFAASRATGLKPQRLRTETSHQGWSDMVTVELRYSSATDVPLVGPLFPDVEVRAKATMRLERGHEATRKPDCFEIPAGRRFARGESCEQGVSGAPGNTRDDSLRPGGPTPRGA